MQIIKSGKGRTDNFQKTIIGLENAVDTLKKVKEDIEGDMQINKSAQAHTLGNLYFNKREFATAIMFYEKVAISYRDFQYFYKLGLSFCERLNYHKEIDCFEKALKLSPPTDYEQMIKKSMRTAKSCI